MLIGEDIARADDMMTVEELARELRLAKVTIYKHLGKWDRQHGVIRRGRRITRIKRSIFMPLWEAEKIPW